MTKSTNEISERKNYFTEAIRSNEGEERGTEFTRGGEGRAFMARMHVT